MKKPKYKNYTVTEVVTYAVLATSEEKACELVEDGLYRHTAEVIDRSAELYKPVNIRKNVAECLG